MTAKEYLGQIKNIDHKLENLANDAAYWRSVASSPASKRLDAVRVQSSPNPDKMADAVAKAIEYSEEAETLYLEGMMLKKTVLDQLNGMEDVKLSTVLRLIYLEDKSTYQIAKMMCYDPRYAKKLSKKAHLEFERQYLDT